MTAGSDERLLATWLAGRSDAELVALFAARGVSASVPWRDYFDAAEGLLDPASVERVLLRMPRAQLVSLAAQAEAGPGSSPDADLIATALVRQSGALPRVVAERLTALRAQHPAAFVAAETPAAGVESSAAQRAAASESAYAATAALADILIAMLARPVARTGAGAVSAADRKRLTEAGVIDEPGDLDDLIEAASAAGLARPIDREWLVTPAGEKWLELPTALRWARVADGFARAIPRGLLDADGAIADPRTWAGLFPLDPDWPARVDRLLRIARAWGILTASDALTPWGADLRAGRDTDAAALAELLPAEIDRIYLQADLSAIAPGPLVPALDLRLRRIAVRESRAQASTYRFSTESIAAGLTEGETAPSITTFLSQLSLTGIPQPLAYLVESTAARHGLVRVGHEGVRTRIESSDAALLAAIEVDQSLRALGLVRDEDVLLSRVARDAVYWSLADARYPVSAHDGSGRVEPLHRARLAADEPASATPPLYADLVARLRAAQGPDAEAAWRERELDQAVRARTVIAVVVRLPDGSSREFVLEATGLGGGRLRGRDRAADIERTLPVASIESVRPV